jgi:aspartyl-tRNA(Asn)/glutamyl-tRNA(Gln) amidotransferase subunit B
MAQRTCVSYRVLVGMEVHVQLATASKMFTGVANASGSLRPGAEPPEPNTAVDPVVLGLPGVLPVINRRAVELSIRAGLAMNCSVAPFTKWDRKSYYYPDLPKNYQISQYDLPLCANGMFELIDEAGQTHRVRIRRAHLEEDAGKLLHEAPGGFAIAHSIVDLNRAGTPLLEIVTEPDLTTPEQVRLFGQELQKLVQYLGVSEGHMQLGQMRFEPNINVHITDEHGQIHKTAITEIKNLNSFSVLERATAYEVQRQVREWEATGSLGRKCTCGWDETTGTTFVQREKEDAHDYRYFPDPDLMPVVVSERWLEEIRAGLGELPAARKKRYVEAIGLSERDASLLAADRGTGEFFDALLAAGADPKRATTLMEALREIANERGVRLVELGISPGDGAQVAALVHDGKLAASKETARTVLTAMASAPGRSAEQVAGELGLIQSTDTGPIDAAIDALLAENPKSLQDYRGGKQAALGSLVGMVMKSTKGLNPRLVQQRLRERLA